MIASGIGCVEELSFIAQGEQLVVLFCRVAALFNKAINLTAFRCAPGGQIDSAFAELCSWVIPR